MTKLDLPEDIKRSLIQFLSEHAHTELVAAYLFYIEKKFNLQPVLFPKEKIIYRNVSQVIDKLEKENALWHEAEIKISFGEKSVDEQTAKIYICPFTGKVFGDNTHPNPQDAIYDWVSKCPENTERVGGLKVKRFFVSEDPDVIKNYIPKGDTQQAKTKQVFSSVLNGKLFSSKKAVIDDFKKNYLKPLTLIDVQNQNRFQIEDEFLSFIQQQLVEEKITGFVEALAEVEELRSFVEHWIAA